MFTKEQLGERLAQYEADNKSRYDSKYGATYSDLWNMCIRDEVREIDTGQRRFVRTLDNIGFQTVPSSSNLTLDSFQWGDEAFEEAKAEIARLKKCVTDLVLIGSWLSGFGGDIVIYRGNLLRSGRRQTVMSIHGDILYKSEYVSDEVWDANGGIPWGHSEAVRLCNELIAGEIEPRGNEFDLAGLR